ncbi:TadE-like protein [Thermomonospora umbrina]|uniref:TadE-like protein n=1 Tax=Thermomonospora umbrina TaxID=111806 RepID=A0A3D9SYW6_9ACTN|nr:TadE-like protein [Thermomonospora umbrina]
MSRAAGGRRRPRPPRGDRGASAVEFGLVVPLMMLIVFATVDFGRLMFAQIIVTQAAREGARAAAVTGSEDAVDTRVNLAAEPLSGVTAGWSGPCPPDATPTVTVSVSVVYSFDFVLLPMGDISLTSRGVVQCQG